MGLEDDTPTVEELINQLRSSFFVAEFQQVAKTLTEREERMNEKHLKLKSKLEEEKGVIFSENLKLKDELKKKESEIEAMRKVVAEYGEKIRVYEKRSLGFDDKVLGSEKADKESMGSSLNLENNEQKDCAVESSRPPLFSKKKDSKTKTEAKPHVIINIDDDDDNDLAVISSIKRRRVERENKRKRGSKETKSELDIADLDSGSDDDDPVDKLYMSVIAKVKKQKEGWKDEADMVKDFEKDDELCLNGVCALHRQKIIVHGSDTYGLSTLARKLIDGDPQNELKKKASDLNHLDLDACRTYAKKYSMQLFKIYLDKKDPFFPTSSGQEKRLDDYK